MTITQNINGTIVINADEGKALRRKTDKGPTRITRVALSATDSADNWTDCEYAVTDEANAATEVPPPRTFSKFALEGVLFNEGLLESVDAIIDAQVITNKLGHQIPLRRRYDTALVFREDHPDFARVFAAIKQTLGVTDEKAEKILAASVED